MVFLPDDEGDTVPAAYDVPRGNCPSCGSGEVTHLVIGMSSGPTDMDGSPAWVCWVGCLDPGFDRQCSTCAASWSAPYEDGMDNRHASPVRVLGRAGAAFALLPVPDLTGPAGDPVLVDVELLSPDRLVRYLARRLHREFLENLAVAWIRCAEDAYPEQSVATVEEAGAGLAVVVVASTPFAVTLEVLIRSDLEGDVLEQDGLSFDVARAGLIDAAHSLQEWLA